ncbi:MAG TPA: alpha/beta hydrolase [Steroidobacteraceae bacterium]|nr:alpha/beta hydrolase [Steroidobacteraceae bacterium]
MRLNRREFALGGLGLILTGSACRASTDVPRGDRHGAPITYWRGYADSPYGQMHFYLAAPADGITRRTPLVCLHQSPTSGVFYREFQSLMATDRLVLCPDTAGYGYSDGPTAPPAMADYGRALGQALLALGFGEQGFGPVDVLGFHTGNYVASELAIQFPTLVRRLVMPSIPYFPAPQRADKLGRYASPRPYFSDPEYIGDSYGRTVLEPEDGLAVARRHELFVSRLLSGPRSHYGFAAVTAYDADTQLKRIAQPTLLPILDETLGEPTRVAAQFFARKTVVDLTRHTGLVWFTNPHALAAPIRAFLDDSGDSATVDAVSPIRRRTRGRVALTTDGRATSPRRHYANTRYGQMHFVTARPAESTSKPPLALLHQSPMSGRVFAALQPLLASDREVLAADTAGFGGSDGPDVQPSMHDLGAALVDAVADLKLSEPLDLFAFHTGAYVATAALTIAPELFGRAILCGVPYYPAAKRQEMQNEFLRPYAFFTDPDYVRDMYKRMVDFDADEDTRLRQLAEFTDRMRAGPQGEWGPRAVFSFEADEALSSIQNPVLLMTFDEVMAEPTRQVRKLIPHAEFLAIPDIKMFGFATHPQRVATAIRDYLDS